MARPLVLNQCFYCDKQIEKVDSWGVTQWVHSDTRQQACETVARPKYFDPEY